MKTCLYSIVALGLFGFLGAAVAQQLPKPGEASAATTRKLDNVIELPQQKLTFAPTRDDFTVRVVYFAVSHLGTVPKEGVLINGAAPKGSQICLKQVGKNQFELPVLRIEYAKDAPRGPLYITLKVMFNEASNQGDSFYYKNLPDRYALLSYCTDEAEDPTPLNARFGANRIKTLKEFKDRLAAPLAINLNDRPIEGAVGYPMFNDAFGVLSPDDVKALKDLVSQRNERYIDAINAASEPARATVFVSVNDPSQYEGQRVYHAVKVDNAWRIASVEERKNGF